MIVEVTRVRFDQVEVDLAEACPRCKADFRQPGNLREDQWLATGQEVHVDTGGFHLEYGADLGPGPDIQTVGCGYTCRRCGWVVLDLFNQADPP
jgi:hypothetical protein